MSNSIYAKIDEGPYFLWNHIAVIIIVLPLSVLRAQFFLPNYFYKMKNDNFIVCVIIPSGGLFAKCIM